MTWQRVISRPTELFHSLRAWWINCVCGRFEMVRCLERGKNGMYRMKRMKCIWNSTTTTNKRFHSSIYNIIIFSVCVKKYSYFYCEYICTFNLINSECGVNKGNEKYIYLIYMVRPHKIEFRDDTGKWKSSNFCSPLIF